MFPRIPSFLGSLHVTIGAINCICLARSRDVRCHFLVLPELVLLALEAWIRSQVSIQPRQDENAAADEAKGDFGECKANRLHLQVGQVLCVQEKCVKDEAKSAGNYRTTLRYQFFILRADRRERNCKRPTDFLWQRLRICPFSGLGRSGDAILSIAG